MAFSRLLNTPVVIRRASNGEPDKYGNPSRVFTDENALARLESADGTEVLDDNAGLRDSVIEYLTAYLDASVSLSSYDQIVIAGATYEVHGTVNTFSGFSKPHHHQVKLRKVSA